GLIGFHGHEYASGPERLDDGKQFDVLNRVILACGMSERGFRTKVNDVGALGVQNFAAPNRRVRGQANALAIPRIGRQVDDPHDGGPRVEGEVLSRKRKFLYARLDCQPVFLHQFRQMFQGKPRPDVCMMRKTGPPTQFRMRCRRIAADMLTNAKRRAKLGAPGANRTRDPLLRRQLLYPSELRAQKAYLQELSNKSPDWNLTF